MRLLHRLLPPSTVGRRIIQTRLALALLVGPFLVFSSGFRDSVTVAAFITVYVLLTYVLSWLSEAVLRRKRVRAIPIAFDIALFSILVALSEGLNGPWFLLYFFPIMSAARYLGSRWSLGVATLVAIAFAVACAFQGGAQFVGEYEFWVRVLVLGGVALTSSNLAKTRDRHEAGLVRAFEEIENEILSDRSLDEVQRLILKAAIDATDSDVGSIVLLGGSTPALVPGGGAGGEADEAIRLVKTHLEQARATGEPVSVPLTPLRGPKAIFRSATKSESWSGIVLPLIEADTPIGALGVFSRLSFHYTADDERRLLSIGPLVAMAQKNARRYQDLLSRNREREERLNMVYAITAELSSESGVEQVFQNAVKLAARWTLSEEAALFIPSDDFGGRLDKVAVAGPDDATRQHLETVERVYAEDAGLTRQVFASNSPLVLNAVNPNEPHAREYGLRLPSGEVRHYMGAPLLIGDQVLGVLRVINKRTASYQPVRGEATLDPDGFAGDDPNLLEMIATQIASAIRNAQFIDMNRHFRDLVYHSADPIIVLDRYGRIQNFNFESERLLGYSEPLILGKSVAEFYRSEEHARSIGRELWRASDHRLHDYPAEVKHADGTLIPIRLAATLVVDKHGQHGGSIGIFTDERAVMRVKIHQLNEEKLAAIGKHAHATAHDIKHHIATIRLRAKGLKEDSPDDPDVAADVNAIDRAAKRILQNVQNMLFTGDSQIVKASVEAAVGLVREFVSEAQDRVGPVKVTVSATYPDIDVMVLVEKEQIRQVLANLLGNSIDAIKTVRHQGRRQAGHIAIVVAVADDRLVIQWTDDGCGMSDEMVANAFTPFYTTKANGTGLGLFLNRRLIENHGGSITLTRDANSRVCFAITLPVFRKASAAAVTS